MSLSSTRIAVKNIRRARRKADVRKGLYGTAERPRLSVFKSARHIYAQIINDADGKTICAASTVSKDIRAAIKYGGNSLAARQVGAALADKAIAAGVKAIVFDRNGFRFHGRLKALAEAAREKGLQF